MSPNLTSLLPTPLPTSSNDRPQSPSTSVSLSPRLPSSDSIVSLLSQSKAAWIGGNHLLVLGQQEVDERYRDEVRGKYREGRVGEGEEVGVWELARRVRDLGKRTKESQSVVFSGLSGSGTSQQYSHFLQHLLFLSTTSPTPTKKDLRITAQLTSLLTILNSFTSSKTIQSTSSSQISTVLEVFYSKSGRLAGAKLLPFGLNKERVVRKGIGKDERSFDVFYQLFHGLRGGEERRSMGLLDRLSDYDLLEGSGCYEVPGKDDGIEFDSLKDALTTIGFKEKRINSIFKTLSAILLLGNIDFTDLEATYSDPFPSCQVANRDLLSNISSLLSLDPDELEKSLTNRSKWIRKEMVWQVLDAKESRKQRDDFGKNLFAILVSYLVEFSNYKLAPGEEVEKKVGGCRTILVKTPGFITSPSSTSTDGNGNELRRRTSLINQSSLLSTSPSSLSTFLTNFQQTLIHTTLLSSSLANPPTISLPKEDGIKLPQIPLLSDGSASLELLRGGILGSNADKKVGGILGGLEKVGERVLRGRVGELEADREWEDGMEEYFKGNERFVHSSRGKFGVRHFAGGSGKGRVESYEVEDFIRKNLDRLDPTFLHLFQNSGDNFLVKLLAGPGLNRDFHPLDREVVVSCQVASLPIRKFTGLRGYLDGDGGAGGGGEGEGESEGKVQPISAQVNDFLSEVLRTIERKTRVWRVINLKPAETVSLSSSPSSSSSTRLSTDFVKQQLSSYSIPELVARKRLDFIYDVSYDGFIERFGEGMERDEGDEGGQMGPRDVQEFLTRLGARPNVEFELGTKRVWLTWEGWEKCAEWLKAGEQERGDERALMAEDEGTNVSMALPETPRRDGRGGDYAMGSTGSMDDLIPPSPEPPHPSILRPHSGYTIPTEQPSSNSPYFNPQSYPSEIWGGGDSPRAYYNPSATNPFDSPGIQYVPSPSFTKESFGEFGGAGGGTTGMREKKEKPAMVEEVPTSRGRRVWVAIVWILTWWIPSVTLKYLGRMKRPDVRMAWREKVALCMLIGFFCGVIIFYIVVFGKLICPDMDKAWNAQEVGYHTGTTDFWVSMRGNVYDLTNFYKLSHSDISSEKVTSDDMLEFAGADLTDYFPYPLTLACPTLVTDNTLSLQYLNFTAILPTAVHTSGSQQTISSSKLSQTAWYTSIFLPKMETFHKGPLVWTPKKVKSEADSLGRLWTIYQGKIYDLTDYFNTITVQSATSAYSFLDSDLANLWQSQPGTDITSAVAALNLDADTLATNMDCINNLFYQGETDFRQTPRCQVQPYLLLAFTVLLATTILAKFLAALQLSSKKTPELRDKFAILQVVCYTEGEESLKKTIDSLATLTYDDKRKLLFIICDGMIVGAGNDRPTPRIVLDILGVDQTVDPDPLMFKSISEGSKQLNYGKVWSGLYEVDGHVVPYVVVAKVGRPSERSRPGNRGKRDSQILAMRFLNRVHFNSEMYPLELELYHQISNVIGVDPQLYEYMLVIDADTSVAPDSLNRLVSQAADDSRIIGICGETRLENEQQSWWTMIQVYEYFISHHMSKAFESLFGSVTCLPGCFTMYRIRSADKGKPLIASSLILDDYSENNLDTLHKKNLLALGEDRYLTTLLLKHFPNYKTKFTPDAVAYTVAPDSWSILLSQRRRWINSTVHNLAELMFLPHLCGFCCFSMRFIVVIDLVGTLILPATFVYLVYLIVTVATGNAALPWVSLVMLAAVYGFQVVIFLLKRQWQYIGWLVIYLLAYPVYSFLLPCYSFWRFDDFTWGNTRVVVGEGKSKKILSNEDEAFDESTIPMKRFADYQAALIDEQTRSIRPDLPRAHSSAGFSIATKLPPGSYQGADFYRDTIGAHSRAPSRMTTNAFGSVPSFGYGAGPGSMHGGSSDYGGRGGGFGSGSFGQSHAPLLPSHLGQMSLAGPPTMAGMPRRDSSMSAFTMGSYGNFPPPTNVAASVYSLNPFLPPTPSPTRQISHNPDPTDAELVSSLKSYLANQDLMSVTKRSTRDALSHAFPNANLGARKDFINLAIDNILAQKI